MEKLLLEIAEGMKRMGERFDQMDERFDRLEAKVDRQDERFDRLEAKVDRQDERFDRLEAKVDRQEERFDQLETKVDEIKVALHSQHIANINSDNLVLSEIRDIKEKVRFVNRRVADVELDMIGKHAKDPN
ncbi:hypothetical protein [Brevibacillus borstelensis]|uniref:hypothetical protein n=1 Tax=Brevibacillus borstelensis TaxID=45462 RepID=UPI0030C3F77D